MAATWRFFARRINGDGTETHIGDIDISDPQRTRTLSGPPGLMGTITPEIKELQGEDGQPILRNWKTALYAEADGQIRGGWLLINSTFDGARWSLDCAGFSVYPTDQPYFNSQYWVDVDPADMVRHIWAHLQSRPRGNLGVVIDSTTTPIRIGKELELVQFDAETSPGVRERVSFEAGPYKLTWYGTHDLGREIDDLASDTPFDWVEEHSWIGDTEDIRHFIRIGYPRIGTRRADMTFEIGRNVYTEPKIDESGEDYADVVVVLGAGEGSAMIRGEYGVATDRITRAAVVEDKSIKSKTAAIERAKNEVALRTGALNLDSVEVYRTPDTPIESIGLGDEFWLTGRAGWVDVAMWVRVVSITDKPGETDSVTLSVVRADLGMM